MKHVVHCSLIMHDLFLFFTTEEGPLEAEMSCNKEQCMYHMIQRSKSSPLLYLLENMQQYSKSVDSSQ